MERIVGVKIRTSDDGKKCATSEEYRCQAFFDYDCANMCGLYHCELEYDGSRENPQLVRLQECIDAEKAYNDTKTKRPPPG